MKWNKNNGVLLLYKWKIVLWKQLINETKLVYSSKETHASHENEGAFQMCYLLKHRKAQSSEFCQWISSSRTIKPFSRRNRSVQWKFLPSHPSPASQDDHRLGKFCFSGAFLAVSLTGLGGRPGWTWDAGSVPVDSCGVLLYSLGEW